MTQLRRSGNVHFLFRAYSAILFVGLAATVSIAQTVSPARVVGGSTQGNVAGVQRDISVSYGALSFLAAWADLRDQRSWDIWFARVSEVPSVTDAPSIPLVRTAGNQTLPALAAGSSSMVLVWLDDSRGGCASGQVAVVAQRFQFDGAPITAPQVLSTACIVPSAPQIAFNATRDEWLVTWGAAPGEHDFHLARLDESPGFIVQSDFVMGYGTGTPSRPVATALGQSYLITWVQNDGAPIAPYIAIGEVPAVGPGVVHGVVSASSIAQRTPWISTDGSSVEVVFAEGAGTGNDSILARRFDVAAQPTSTTVTVATGTPGLANPRTTFSATTNGTYVVYERGSTPLAVYGRTISTSGTVSGEYNLGVTSGWTRFRPAVAVGNSTVLVGMTGEAPDYISDLEALGTVFTKTTLAVRGTTAFSISRSAGRAKLASAAFDGARTLVGWREDGLASLAGRMAVRWVERLGGQGAANWISPSQAMVFGDGTVAASPDAGFAVVWGDHSSGTECRIQTLDRDGGANAPGRALSGSGVNVYYPTTAWLEDGYVTAYLLTFGTGIVVTKSSRLGAVMSAPSTLFTLGTQPAKVKIGASADTALIGFQVAGQGLDIRAGRWKADAGGLDVSPITITPWAGDQTEPSIAGGPGAFLVVWREASDAGLPGSDIYARRVGLNAALLDAPFRVSNGSTSGSSNDLQPSVGWDGLSYVVVWVRGTSIVGARVSAQGVLVDATPFVVSSGNEFVANPFVAGESLGVSAVAYEAFEPAAPFHSIVAQVRFVAFNAENDAGIDAGEVDAGEVDAGEVDAGEVDAGEVDAGEVDAGEVDAGEVDAGEVDAGEVDAGEVDAGEVDAGEVDAGQVDAGTGTRDAGGVFDGGPSAPDPSVLNLRVACSCNHVSVPLWLAVMSVMRVLFRGRITKPRRACTTKAKKS